MTSLRLYTLALVTIGVAVASYALLRRKPNPRTRPNSNAAPG